LYLEHSNEGLREAVKRAAGLGLVGKVKLPSKHLHTQQGEDDDEKEEKQQQAGDGTDRVQEGSHQITERLPVSRAHSITSIRHWDYIYICSVSETTFVNKKVLS